MLDTLAVQLADYPEGGSKEQKDQLEKAALQVLEQQIPTSVDTRQALSRVAARADYGWNLRVLCALAGLPWSKDSVWSLLPQTTCSKPALVERYQQLLLSCPEPDPLLLSFCALYQGPGTEHAEAALRHLGGQNAALSAWKGVSMAALDRPALQVPLLRYLSQHPQLVFAPIVAWIAEYGCFSAETLARSLLQNPTPPLAAIRPPWSVDERRALRTLWTGAPPTEQACQHLKALADRKMMSVPDLIVEICESPHLAADHPLLQATLVEICIDTDRRRVASAAASVLLRGRREPLPIAARQRLAVRAGQTVEGLNLTLARLSLPESLPLWAKLLPQQTPHTDVPRLDQSLAFGLPDASAVLCQLYACCTPNQRRLLLADAPFAQFPHTIPTVIDWFRREDLSSVPVLLKRLLEQRPVGLQDALLSFVTEDLPLPIRIQAVDALGEIGDRQVLLALGRVKGVDVARAQAAIRARLQAAGEDMTPGSLQIVRDDGGLTLASVGGTAPSTLPPLPPDPRWRVLPPPRKLSLSVWLVYGILASNRWGCLWINVLLFALVMIFGIGLSLEPKELIMMFFLCIPWFVNHLICRTLTELRALRDGVVLAATVQARHTITQGKNKRTIWLHHYRLLTDDGKVYEWNQSEEKRRESLLDERHEPVLALLSSTGALLWVRGLDDLKLTILNEQGNFQTSFSSYAFLFLATLPWLWILYGRLT